MQIPPQVIIANYLVAYVDVLGQKDELLSIEIISAAPEVEQQAMKVVRNTAEYILSLRKQFQTFFKSQIQQLSLLDHVAPDQKANLLKMRRCEARVRGVSDSIIITVPLYDESGPNIPVWSIYATLYGVCAIFLLALKQGKPIRGGVDIGWGVSLNPNEVTRSGEVFTKEEVYGGALARAYQLESQVAKYPRIVIGDLLWRYLSEAEQPPSDTEFTFDVKKIASMCKQLITEDVDDGKRTLDVAGSGVKEVGKVFAPSLIQGAYSFVASEYRRQSQDGDAKLAPRYGQLKKYFDSRLQF